MAATFPCPHCGATYPVKPVLVGRPVRCTKCRQVFKLREEGYADKVGGEAPAPPPQPAAAAPAGSSAARAEATAAKAQAQAQARAKAKAKAQAKDRSAAAAATAPSPPQDEPGTAAEKRKQQTKRILQKKDELRRSMAATLSDAASKALGSAAAEREEAAEQRPKKKRGTASHRRAESGGVGDIGPAVLVGSGRQEAINNRLWLAGFLAFVALIGGCVYLFSGESPRRAALIALVEPPLDEQGQITQEWKPPRRIPFIQSTRPWLADPAMPVILDIEEARISGVRTLALTGLGDVVEKLKGRVFIGELGLWAPADRVGEIQARRQQQPSHGTIDGFVMQLERDGFDVMTSEEVRSAMIDAGMSEEAAAIATMLLERQTDFMGGNWIRDRIFAGELPTALEVSPFFGTGRQLQRKLNSYTSEENVPYRGRLLRFVGWEGQQHGGRDLGAWRVLDIQRRGENGFPPTPGWP